MPFGGKRITSHWLKIISFEDGSLGSFLLPVNIELRLYHSLPCIEGRKRERKKIDVHSLIAKVAGVEGQLQRHLTLTCGLSATSSESLGT